MRHRRENYRAMFRSWGPKWNKYWKEEDTEILSVQISRRKASGKESEVYRWGELVPKERVNRSIKRSNPSYSKQLQVASTLDRSIVRSFCCRADNYRHPRTSEGTHYPHSSARSHAFTHRQSSFLRA